MASLRLNDRGLSALRRAARAAGRETESPRTPHRCEDRRISAGRSSEHSPVPRGSVREGRVNRALRSTDYALQLLDIYALAVCER